jgi:hypothetical protein
MRRFIEIILTCLMIGIGFAGLFGYWNAQGIIVDEYITGSITITDLQTGVVFIWVIIGAILGVVTKR